MSTRVLKVLFLQSLFVLSLLLSACGEGDRGFVPLPEEEVEEEIGNMPVMVKSILCNLHRNYLTGENSSDEEYKKTYDHYGITIFTVLKTSLKNEFTRLNLFSVSDV